MTARLTRLVDEARAAVLSGDPAAALKGVERMAEHLAQRGLAPSDRAEVEAALARLLALAQASARGTEKALEQIRDIIRSARSLQTYDRQGQRQSVPTVAGAPHRF